ncbi:DedA family protein [Metabacillus fastidiosus]|uniref:DedA family protein n=1 Tax=Metabacillus fastidiosus TaxID=1458 RepID=A0ABU6NZV7_9BACI|nr:DedA family protein [Metabacillus fastidiosus]MED4402630.1 DedA family protein [Metabacillus fastidiosus]MED4461990.1 DedA family protein [Metabacillus fastidiosus]
MAEWEYIITNYSYMGLFFILILGIVGLPIPDEVLLTFVGYYIFLEKMDFWPSIGCAIIGSIVGISISYLIGKYLGSAFLKKYGPKFFITEKKTDWVQAKFNNYGPLFLISGYFIPGVRHVTAYVAGMSTYHFGKFACFAYIGAVVWASTFIFLGHYLGGKWTEVEVFFSHTTRYVWGFIALIAISAIFIRLKKKKSI